MSSRYFTFASIARPSWRYRLYKRDSENPAYDWRRLGDALCSSLSQYDTMGDGEVQHSPECRVDRNDCYDVVTSLASQLHEIQIDIRDRENCQSEVLGWFWRCDPSASDEEIRFALDLKYNEKKDTYYTFKDDGCRKSFAESKRHDRRWMKLDRFNEEVNSTVEMNNLRRVMSILFSNESGCQPHGLIQHVATVMRICEIIAKDSSRWLASRQLFTKDSVLQETDTKTSSDFFSCFERITTFKKSVHNLQWTIEASKRQSERIREKSVAAV